MKKFVICMLLVLVPISMAFAQESNASLDETLNWIKAKVEKTIPNICEDDDCNCRSSGGAILTMNIGKDGKIEIIKSTDRGTLYWDKGYKSIVKCVEKWHIPLKFLAVNSCEVLEGGREGYDVVRLRFLGKKVEYTKVGKVEYTKVGEVLSNEKFRRRFRRKDLNKRCFEDDFDIVGNSKNLAHRLLKAFKHVAKLCGAKKEPF